MLALFTNVWSLHIEFGVCPSAYCHRLNYSTSVHMVSPCQIGVRILCHSVMMPSMMTIHVTNTVHPEDGWANFQATERGTYLHLYIHSSTPCVHDIYFLNFAASATSQVLGLRIYIMVVLRRSSYRCSLLLGR